MKIIHKSEATHINKPEGNKVDYYLRPEYEVHYNEQPPHATVTWHFHEKVFESLFIIEGKLTAKWKEGNKNIEGIVKAGDLIEVEGSPHTFTNHTDEITKFIVIKQVLSGKDRTEIFKTDKVTDGPVS